MLISKHIKFGAKKEGSMKMHLVFRLSHLLAFFLAAALAVAIYAAVYLPSNVA